MYENAKKLSQIKLLKALEPYILGEDNGDALLSSLLKKYHLTQADLDSYRPMRKATYALQQKQNNV